LKTENASNTVENQPMPGKRMRMVYLLLAYSATLLGIAGIFLPLLPATPFLLVAVWAASRGSQRLHDWIYSKPRFARILNDWHQQGAVPISAKWLATAMMIASFSFLLWSGYHWGVLLGMSLLFLTLCTFLWTRPNPLP
jgi:uncharacterized membrane protein YbaN (DUF454 family)